MRRLGRYEILEEIGRGAMGTVYRARDPKIDRIVALKTITVLGLSGAEEEEYGQRFFREAQAAGKLSHGGLVTIYDVGEDEATQTPFIVMEFIEGQTLEKLIGGAAAERFPLERALDLVQQIAEALDYAHSRGIIHRDIKPANIMVTEDGRAKIADFGIAKLAMTHFTQAGQVLGTPAYMSPEQLSGGAVDGRSDLFSLGVILYWLLTGDKPFAGDSATAVSFKVVYKEIIPVSELNPTLSSDFDYVVGRALAKGPAQRYQRGKEFAEDVEDLRQGRQPRSLGAVAAEGVSERTVVTKPAGPRPQPGIVAPSAARLPRARWFWLWGQEAADRVGRWMGLTWQSGTTQAALGLGQRALAYARRLSPKTYAVLALGALAVFGLLRLYEATRPKATLNIQCQHSFRSAKLMIWADDDRIFEGELTGTVRERFAGLVKSIEGNFAGVVQVPAGKRVIRVRVSALEDGYEQTKEIQGEFAKDEVKTLYISFGQRGRSLFLTLGD